MRPQEAEAGAESRVRTPPTRAYELIVIGASTGGPSALVTVLSWLPQELLAGVVIAQHMPPGFTRTLAQRLDRCTPLAVAEAADGDPVRPGRALIAPGGTQVHLEREESGLVLRVGPSGPDYLHRPSIDHLFRSTAEVAGRSAIGVVLTGMGDDGAAGLRALREAGAYTVAESQATAVIYGMPRAAAPAAHAVLRLDEIGPRLAALCTAVRPD